MQHLDPQAAYAFMLQRPEALLVDCRTEIEFLYVGHPVGAEHVAWQEAPDWEIDPGFVDNVKYLVRGNLELPVLVICRSGHRSLHAADALEAAGFANVINVLEGFEGHRDENNHRGTLGGWRFRGLPWQQT